MAALCIFGARPQTRMPPLSASTCRRAKFGGGYPACRAQLYGSFATGSQQVHLLRADSHSSGTARQLQKLLGGRTIDFLFIDGDHTYAGVKQDFELYSRLLSKDGLVALHDIAPRPDEPRIEVWKFWRELKQRVPGAREWLDKSPNGRCIGIGLLPAQT